MADNYRVVGTERPNTDWTSEVVLERDNDGTPSKVVSTTQSAELSSEDLDTLKRLGVKVEKVTAKQLKEEQQRAAAGGSSDTLAAAPLLGDGNNDQDK
jgi:hypothetical protein